MTTRDSDALQIEKWAASGDVATPESTGLVRATGWPLSYSQFGGDTPSREVFNQMLREITGMLTEINRKGGILPWDAGVAYEHPAMVMGSDNKVYLSVQDSTNRNPTTDAADTYWREFDGDAIDPADYLPYGNPPTSLTDWNDLDHSVFPTGAYATYFYVPGSGSADHRPFNYTGRLIVVMYRTGLTSISPIMVQAYPIINGDSGAGIGPFKRVKHQNSWGDWGLEGGLFASAHIQNTEQLVQTIVTPVNISLFDDIGVGIFRFRTILLYQSNEIPSIQLTARNSGSMRSITVGDVADTEYTCICWNTNGAQQDPFGIELAMFIGAQAPPSPP